MNERRIPIRTLGCITAVIAALTVEARVEHAAHGRTTATRLPTGQFVTPTALRGAVQQYLNPGLSAYPKFIAGEAVRSRLSPDGATLAVLCAGHNSLYGADGKVDMGAST